MHARSISQYSARDAPSPSSCRRVCHSKHQLARSTMHSSLLPSYLASWLLPPQLHNILSSLPIIVDTIHIASVPLNPACPSKQHITRMLSLKPQRLQLLQRPCILRLIRSFLFILGRFDFGPIALLPAGGVVVFAVEILREGVVLVGVVLG